MKNIRIKGSDLNNIRCDFNIGEPFLGSDGNVWKIVGYDDQEIVVYRNVKDDEYVYEGDGVIIKKTKLGRVIKKVFSWKDFWNKLGGRK